MSEKEASPLLKTLQEARNVLRGIYEFCPRWEVDIVLRPGTDPLSKARVAGTYILLEIRYCLEKMPSLEATSPGAEKCLALANEVRDIL